MRRRHLEFVHARDRQRLKAGEAPAGVDEGVRVLGEVEFVRGNRCEEVLPLLPEGVFDACVTDPPYGIGIAEWDADVPGVDVWAAVFRVLKAGAWLIAFGARRTYDLLGVAIRDAGFQIVDQGIWVYGTGRPPSKQHLKPAHEPFVIAVKPGGKPYFDVDAGRIPWGDSKDRACTSRINTLRASGERRPVYSESMNEYGRDAFSENAGGRWPSTVMATEAVLGKSSHIYVVPKVRNVKAHSCAKPPDLIAQIVKPRVPPGGVVLDPYAGSGVVGDVAAGFGRRAVLIDQARAEFDAA